MIRALGPRSPTELNVALLQTTGGVTNTLTRLEKAGLIVRERVGRDRRSVEVRLTAAPAGARPIARWLSSAPRCTTAAHGSRSVSASAPTRPSTT